MSAKHNVNNAYLLDEELTAEKIEMRVSRMTLPNNSPSSNTSLSNLSITSDYNKPTNLPQFADIEAAKPSFKPKSKIKRQLNKYRRPIQTCLKLVLVAGWLTYLGFACVDTSETPTSFNKDTIPLLVITAIGFAFKTWTIIKNLCKDSKIVVKILDKIDQHPKIVKICLMLTGLAIVIPSVTVILISDGQVSNEQWISLAGYFIIPGCFWVFSVDRRAINWQPVIGGFLLQLIFGIFVLKVPLGNQIFEYLSEVVAIALDCVEAGVAFVFGPTWEDHRFAFKTLPIIIFVSSIVSVLYYVGAMQWIILKIGWLMHALLGTSATESMVAAGNIFIGQTESPLLVRPYLKDCTNSELLAIMAAGMATIAGSVLGAFLAFGANGVFLMTASDWV